MADIVKELPEDFLDGEKLSENGKKILVNQINRFNSLREQIIKTTTIVRNGKIVFPEGTIFHGTRIYDQDAIKKLEGIASLGIITGQAVGLHEDGETFYCADFFRVQKDISVEEFQQQFEDRAGYTPFSRGNSSIAFIITPNPELDEILKYDCYREGTKESEIAKEFVNMAGLPRTGAETESVSSILYGVPSNFISMIAIGDILLESKEIIEAIIKLFPEANIISKVGEIIYEPNMNDLDQKDIINLRREKCLLSAKNRELQKEIEIKNNEKEHLKKTEEQKMINILMSFPTELSARILLASGYQTSLEGASEYVDNLKKTETEPISKQNNTL